MKRLGMFLMFVLSMVMANHHAMAQEITIVLKPGCNWISYPNAEAMDIATALGDFTPAEGDIIKSQTKGTKYTNGQWSGSLRRFTPGIGYQYYSRRSTTVSFAFYTGIPQVTVTTATPTSVTNTSAVCGGTVTMGGQGHVFARGFCWSTHHKPTYDDNHTSDGTDIGSFSHTLEGLNPNTVYYVRAYVVSDGGLSYGNEKGFRTLEGAGIPEGAIDGKFTINADGDQVYFSQGNLQYRASTNTWRFAENQWDYVGTNNSNISSTYNGWIDLFGWGTSGYNHNDACYQPWSTSENNSYYYAYANPGCSLYDQNGKADWGYNAISNGGNQENSGWRTLTKEEWDYVFNSRNTTSNKRYAKAMVNGKFGILLLPDDWDDNIYPLNSVNSPNANSNSNVINATGWEMYFAPNGVIFLPAAGRRRGTSAYLLNSSYYGGFYYSSSRNGNNAYSIEFNSNSDGSGHFVSNYSSERYFGQSVRLVRDTD